MKRRSLGPVLCFLLACSEAKQTPAPDTHRETPSVHAETWANASTKPVNTRVEVPETAEKPAQSRESSERGQARFESARNVPPRACVVSSRQKLDLASGPSALALHEGQLYVWFSRANANARELVRMRVEDSRIDLNMPLASSLATLPVVHADRADGARVVTLLEDATLSLSHFERGKHVRTQALARGVDRRFAPALVTSGTASAVAYTHAVDEGMHVSVTRVDGEKQTTFDITPVSHGACAPTFVLGSKAPTLVMIDARAGVSPLLEIPFDSALKPAPAIVRTPVSQPYSPTELWAVQPLGADVEVAYTAVGKAAATAIGRVPLREAKSALPLLPSRGYGRLHFAAALGARAAVFALTSPLEAKANGPLAIELVVFDARGEGPHVTIEGNTRGAALSLVSFGQEGRFALLHESDEGRELVWLRCDA